MFTDFDDESYLKNKVTEKLFCMDLIYLFCSRRASIKLVNASVIVFPPLKGYAFLK